MADSNVGINIDVTSNTSGAKSGLSGLVGMLNQVGSAINRTAQQFQKLSGASQIKASVPTPATPASGTAGPALRGGADQAQAALKALQDLDQSSIRISQNMAKNLPQGLTDALNKMKQADAAYYETSLKTAVTSFEEKKTAYESATQAMIAAEKKLQEAQDNRANAQKGSLRTANTAVTAAKKGYTETAKAAKTAEDAMVKADQEAAKAAQQTAGKVAGYWNQSAKEATKAQEDFARKVQQAFNMIKRTGADILNNFNRMANGIRQAAQGLQELTQLIAVTIAAPLGLFLRSATTDAMSFEQEMAKVKKAVNIGDSSQFDVLTQRIRNLAKITPTAVEQLATFAEQAGQIGIEGMPAVYRWTNLMNKLMIGTDVDASSISEDMGRIANAFGMNLNTEEGMSQMEKLASVMDMVAKKTATDMDGIVTSVMDAAVIGPMLKIPTQAVVAMVGELISSGVDASAAGTNLSRFFAGALKNADKFAGMMKGYKREIIDHSTGLVTGFTEPYSDMQSVIDEINAHPVDVLTDALGALANATEPDRAQALKNFFDSVGYVGARIGAMAKNYKELKALIRDSNNEFDEATTLQMDYAAMLMTTQSQVQIFKNNFRDLGMTLGSVVLPKLNEIMQYMIPLMQTLGDKFMALSGPTQLLIVGIPILVVALTPLLFIVTTIIHSFGLLAGSLLSISSGMWGLSTSIIGTVGKLASGLPFVTSWLGKLGMMKTVTTIAADGTTAVAKSVFSLGGAFSKAGGFLRGIVSGTISLQGVFSGLFKALLAFAQANPIILIATTIIGVFATLSKFGLDLGKYFINLADSARAWGERLMTTYANGMLGGAARAISKVLTTVAGWIANFFEAHSPPKEGPLRTIDKWGTTLMNTYLSGFALADFGILDDVGNMIKDAFDIFEGLGQIGDGEANTLFSGVREALTQLIDAFDKTGEIAENVLAKIGDSLGSLGADYTKLIRLQLQYKQVQKQIADLENQKKQTLKNYDAEIAKISKLNVSAEEKAELMRQAMAKRDDELDQTSQQEQAAQDQADVIKDQLDWQKEYIKAQLETLDLLRKQNEEKKNTDQAAVVVAALEMLPGTTLLLATLVLVVVVETLLLMLGKRSMPSPRK